MREVEQYRNSRNTTFVNNLKGQLKLRLTAQIIAYGTAASIALILLSTAHAAADLEKQKGRAAPTSTNYTQAEHIATSND